MSQELKVRIPKEAYEDLHFLASFGTKLIEISTLFEGLEPHLSLRFYEDELIRRLRLQAHEAHRAVRIIITLHILLERSGENTERFLSLLSTAIESGAEPDWKEKYFEIWQDNKQFLVPLLSLPNFRLTIKAQRLAYDHQNLLHDTFIITDIRPIFDDDRLDIIGSIINNTLTITYLENKETKNLHLAVDVTDIEKLKNQCDRTLSKIKQTKIQLKGTGWFVLVPGEDNNE